MPSDYKRSEPIGISGVTGQSQQLTVLEAEVSLSGNEWQKHHGVTGPKSLCILGAGCLRRGDFKDPKEDQWASGVAIVKTEDIKQLSILPGLSEDPSVWGCCGSKNNRCRSLPQRCTGSSVTPRLLDAHPEADSSTGEPRSDQQDSLTLYQSHTARAKA